jgi:hypothetical protein
VAPPDHRRLSGVAARSIREGRHLTADPLELVGLLVACGSAAAALVLNDGRLRVAAIGIALVAAPALVLGDVWDEPRVEDFRDSTLRVAAAVGALAAAVAALAVAFHRWPQAFPIAAFALLPVRIPIEIGGETANLLVPLYLVIAAQAIATAVVMAARAQGRGLGHRREAGLTGRKSQAVSPPPPPSPTAWTLTLKYLLALTLILYAAQAAYSEDVSNAIENAGFFLTPFAVMLALLLEVEWSRRLLGRVLIAVGAVAAAMAAIALYQYAARDLFLNPELFDANQLHQYFRVNSLFFDPNILGRYLALAVTALAAYVAWAESRAGITAASLACLLALAGLALSYSITSFAALLAGLGMVALLRWGARGAVAAGSLVAAAAVALLIAGGTPGSDIQTDRGIDSGREPLVEGGLELAGDRPVAGWGSGSFGAAFYERIERARTTVSHSEPITVAAEQGAVGLLAYAAVVGAALLTVLRGAGGTVARVAVAACFVTMLVHSLGYAGFASDPATWALLGLGLGLRRDPPEASATITT